jgi:uncharacterized membrane protein YfcA
VRTTIGVATIVVAGVAILAVVTSWRRAHGRTPLVLLAVLGAAVGAGALLLLDDSAFADWAVTLFVLAVATPVHFRFMLGPPGVAR